jgi:hypothetical protein
MVSFATDPLGKVVFPLHTSGSLVAAATLVDDPAAVESALTVVTLGAFVAAGDAPLGVVVVPPQLHSASENAPIPSIAIFTRRG